MARLWPFFGQRVEGSAVSCSHPLEGARIEFSWIGQWHSSVVYASFWDKFASLNQQNPVYQGFAARSRGHFYL